MIRTTTTILTALALTLSTGTAHAQRRSTDQGGRTTEALRQELLRARAAHQALDARVQELLRLLEERSAGERKAREEREQHAARLEKELEQQRAVCARLEAELQKARTIQGRAAQEFEVAQRDASNRTKALEQRLATMESQRRQLEAQLRAANSQSDRNAKEREARYAKLRSDSDQKTRQWMQEREKLLSSLRDAQRKDSERIAAVRSLEQRVSDMKKSLASHEKTIAGLRSSKETPAVAGSAATTRNAVTTIRRPVTVRSTKSTTVESNAKSDSKVMAIGMPGGARMVTLPAGVHAPVPAPKAPAAGAPRSVHIHIEEFEGELILNLGDHNVEIDEVEELELGAHDSRKKAKEAKKDAKKAAPKHEDHDEGDDDDDDDDDDDGHHEASTKSAPKKDAKNAPRKVASKAANKVG
ncbi:MAG: hypothetical protein H6832_06015 [Planctomycetes bacterium]|nr:hypothetical protein [Planctomycetota bacterium]MCB9917941.1 hypothetical protein [Planctomycetota bacterium]